MDWPLLWWIFPPKRVWGSCEAEIGQLAYLVTFKHRSPALNLESFRTDQLEVREGKALKYGAYSKTHSRGNRLSHVWGDADYGGRWKAVPM